MAVLNRALLRARPRSLPPLKLRAVLLFAGVAIVVVSLLQVVQTSRATTANFNINRLEQRQLQLQMENEQLEAEVAGLSSLARVQQEAKRLGLVAPKNTQSITVNVPWPDAEEDQLPTRFEPAGQTEEERSSDGGSWWQDLEKLLPFR